MIKKKTITITYLFPGVFFPESTTKEVQNTDIPTTIPADCYGFYFQETESVFDEDKNKEFIGETKQIGKTYLIGELIYVDDIPAMDGGRDTDILKNNIRNNSPTKCGVKCHTGNWQMEDEYNTVLSPSQFVIGKPELYENWGKTQEQMDAEKEKVEKKPVTPNKKTKKNKKSKKK